MLIKCEVSQLAQEPVACCTSILNQKIIKEQDKVTRACGVGKSIGEHIGIGLNLSLIARGCNP